MTHDELLAKIDDLGWTFEGVGEIWVVYEALRAVVVRHSPAKDNEGMEEEYPENDGIGCAGCGYDFEHMMWESRYPCLTIQDIEKELK